jgi:hypothetical protein
MKTRYIIVKSIKKIAASGEKSTLFCLIHFKKWFHAIKWIILIGILHREVHPADHNSWR